jgi:hypothetical protein
MGEVVSKCLLVIALPLAVFMGGGWILQQMSGRESLPGQKPLNQHIGYKIEDVRQYWGALDGVGREAERRSLELDLIFPFLYMGALATSLLIAWAMLGRFINPAWILGLAALTMLADWTENLVQLAQLRRYAREGADALQGGWIGIASAATTMKLVGSGIASLALLALVAIILFRAVKSA